MRIVIKEIIPCLESTMLMRIVIKDIILCLESTNKRGK